MSINDSTECPIFFCLMGKGVNIKDFKQLFFVLSILLLNFIFCNFQRVWQAGGKAVGSQLLRLLPQYYSVSR